MSYHLLVFGVIMISPQLDYFAIFSYKKERIYELWFDIFD